MNRLIAIGDIHGQNAILEKILVAINPQPEDVFVFLGDYIDRGPDSKGVIETISDLQKKCQVHLILGNHEEMTLAALAGGKSDHIYWCHFGGQQMLESYQVDHVSKLPSDYWRFIAKCVDFVETENHIFVHAGCLPSIPIEKNTASTFRWDRFPENPQQHVSGKKVVCGHSAREDIFDLGFICCIDTGCGVLPKGKLTALDVNSGQYWQANSKKVKTKK